MVHEPDSDTGRPGQHLGGRGLKITSSRQEWVTLWEPVSNNSNNLSLGFSLTPLLLPLRLCFVSCWVSGAALLPGQARPLGSESLLFFAKIRNPASLTALKMPVIPNYHILFPTPKPGRMSPSDILIHHLSICHGMGWELGGDTQDRHMILCESIALQGYKSF